MGASVQGDIRELCEIAEPDFGILTNVGYAHLEGFGDLATVRRTKMELLDFVPVAAVNADSAELMEGFERYSYKGRLIRFGLGEAADVRATQIRLSGSMSTFRLHIPEGDIEVSLRVAGLFNIHNALAAASAGVMCGIGAGDIKAGLEAFAGIAMRLELKEFKGATACSSLEHIQPQRTGTSGQ
jgi:UDP-N-acetylmuramoyl-tripeptide--D-alanyl-D-alanine ligase